MSKVRPSVDYGAEPGTAETGITPVDNADSETGKIDAIEYQFAKPHFYTLMAKGKKDVTALDLWSTSLKRVVKSTFFSCKM